MSIALYFDFKIKKIPNKLNFFIVLFGIFFKIFQKGFSFFPNLVFEIVIIFTISFAIYHFKVIGAGDLKFFIALTPLTGYEMIIKLIGISIIVGAVNYTFYLLSKGELISSFKNFFRKGLGTRMMYMHNIVIGYFLYQLFNFFIYCI
jgi:prepilin peptidase CpaA